MFAGRDPCVVSAVEEHAQKHSLSAIGIAAYLAVNSSKLSSWCPPSSERRMLLVLKLLAEPEVAIRVGTA